MIGMDYIEQLFNSLKTFNHQNWKGLTRHFLLTLDQLFNYFKLKDVSVNYRKLTKIMLLFSLCV